MQSQVSKPLLLNEETNQFNGFYWQSCASCSANKQTGALLKKKDKLCCEHCQRLISSYDVYSRANSKMNIGNYEINIKTIGIALFILASIFCFYEIWSLKGEKSLEKRIKTELKLVNVLTRHGDRSPADDFPKGDPHKNDYQFFWPNGLHNMTETGKFRMYRVGLELRRQYAKYLDYDPSHILAFSSTYYRCKETTELMLKGMFDMEWTKDRGMNLNLTSCNNSVSCFPEGPGSPDDWKKIPIDDKTIPLVFEFLNTCKYRKDHPSPLDTDLMVSPAIKSLTGINLLRDTILQRYDQKLNLDSLGLYATIVSEMHLVRTASTANYSKHYLEWVNKPISEKYSEIKLFDLYEQVAVLGYRDRVKDTARYIQISQGVRSIIESQMVALGMNTTNDRQKMYKGKKIILYTSHDSIMQLFFDSFGIIHIDPAQPFVSRFYKWHKSRDHVGKLTSGLKMTEYGASVRFELFEQSIEGSDSKFAFVNAYIYNNPDGKFHDIDYKIVQFGLMCRRIFFMKYPKASKSEFSSYYDAKFNANQDQSCPFKLFRNITADLIADDNKLDSLCSNK